MARAKPSCMTAPPEEEAVYIRILFADDEAAKPDVRRQVSQIGKPWQFWAPRLKTAVRADVARLIPQGRDDGPAVAAGYSAVLALTVLHDLGRL